MTRLRDLGRQVRRPRQALDVGNGADEDRAVLGRYLGDLEAVGTGQEESPEVDRSFERSWDPESPGAYQAASQRGDG
jgi:hypothetical protein